MTVKMTNIKSKSTRSKQETPHRTHARHRSTDMIPRRNLVGHIRFPQWLHRQSLRCPSVPAHNRLAGVSHHIHNHSRVHDLSQDFHQPRVDGLRPGRMFHRELHHVHTRTKEKVKAIAAGLEATRVTAAFIVNSKFFATLDTERKAGR